MTGLLSWAAGRVAGAAGWMLALALAGASLWQTARIEGLPLIGGGLKAEIAALREEAATQTLAMAKAEAAALRAREALRVQGQAEARAQLASAAATRNQIRTLIEKVPVYVSAKNDAACVVPVGAVRLLDAAASGISLDAARAAIAPGQPDDAASDVALSEIARLLAADLGIARENADQLSHLQKAVAGN